ncbi:Glycosyltransferase, catalytic subunit of cellulose synthase and poly-beta-1,6-N-acetylglucosamine synthase [Marinobacter segnicrescens]|uniref:Glycosyltransferase, catalytic subunit of cellulose synthase and poly-beta-1,6-N-acetylglucosamine synthase n=1 Tax=Marinobacter segnicrescens TaxID=430453 RepID=A0A1I0H1V6_9GAMM|nr:glycosyltransferase family 2 protein [Marinobacter segnicrescens]SET76805.1 Glycosyltransferase, catalytic subunit of cellulose synthase and poly-beta-1,6-N-acetylglucosamine synthase [Marinobacter segnicrescens]
MNTLLLLITLLCLFIPVYVYAGYPLALWLLTLGRDKVTHRVAETRPSVALIISCYNEAAVIRDKLENALALDYPRDRLSILVVSDGSDDGTDDIVKQYTESGVELIRQEGRLGKTMGLNLAMEQVDADVTVFSDANAMYAPDAIHKLVRNFADERVGYVVGAALYTDGDSGASAKNENLYWRYELAIKSMESRLHSVVGGDGAIYAIRSHLWQPLEQKDINDFVNPLQIIARGYRGIFEPEAKCYEETAGEFNKELARKERIVNRSIRGLMRVREVMNPFRTGIFSWQVISHKLLRWLIPFFLLAGLCGSMLLSLQGPSLYTGIVAGALLVVALGFVGALMQGAGRQPMLFAVPYYFLLVNLNAMTGIVMALSGKTQITWSSARAQGDSRGPGLRWQTVGLFVATIVLAAALLGSLGV